MNFVAPFTMELATPELNLAEFVINYLAPFLVFFAVYPGMHFKTFFGSGKAGEINNYLV